MSTLGLHVWEKEEGEEGGGEGVDVNVLLPISDKKGAKGIMLVLVPLVFHRW
jgi:hypothetical protein